MNKNIKELTTQNLATYYWVIGLTMADIGRLHGVTREYIRQLMNKYNIPSRSVGKKAFETLSEYITGTNSSQDDSNILHRLIQPVKCQKCGSGKAIHIHHRQYPIRSEDDYMVLCAKCHKREHNPIPQRDYDIYNEYLAGETTVSLSAKHNMSRINIYKIIERIKSL